MFFFLRRWDKASNELNSHVVKSKARKATLFKSSPAPPTANANPSAFSRISNAIFGTRSEANAVERKPTTEQSKRSYGFATKNLALYSDKNSEDLYRYKNLSSDYMRSSSPTHEVEDKPADVPNTSIFTIKTKKNNDDDDDDSDDSDE